MWKTSNKHSAESSRVTASSPIPLFTKRGTAAIVLALFPLSPEATPAFSGLTPSETLRLQQRQQTNDLSIFSIEIPKQKRQLQQPSRAIDPQSPGMDLLIQLLEKTARHQGGLGIAAVQIGIPVRVILIHRQNAEGGERFQSFINPRITHRSSHQIASWENCLSIPWGYRYTYRPAQITLRHDKANHQTRTEILKGEESVILQQEIDHLNGLLLNQHHSKKWFIPPDKMTAFARPIWQECQNLSQYQCGQIMRIRWEKRAMTPHKP